MVRVFLFPVVLLIDTEIIIYDRGSSGLRLK